MKSYLTTLGRRVFAAVITLAIAAAAAPVVLAADPPTVYDLNAQTSSFTIQAASAILRGSNPNIDISCVSTVTNLTLDGAEAGMLIFEGDSTLNITGSSRLKKLQTSAGQGSSDLTIAGGGTLTVDATAQGGTAVGVTGALTLESGTLTAKGGAESTAPSHGVYAKTGLTVNVGGELTAIGGEATASSGSSYGVYAPSGSVTVAGKLTATGGKATTGSYGVNANSGVTVVSGGTVTATGGVATANSYGVCANDNITVESGGELTAIGGEATAISGSSYGVHAMKGSVTVAGKLTANGGAANGADGKSYGVNAKTDLDVASGGELTATGGAAIESYGAYASSGDITVKGGIVTATGGAATGANGSSYGVASPNSGNITVEGGIVTANGGAATGADGKSYGAYAQYGITVSGTGTLNATGGTATANSYGVFASKGDITVEGGTLDATGGSGTTSYGVYLKGSTASISFNGGTLLAKGNTEVVSGVDSIMIGDSLPSYTVSTVEGTDGVPVTGKLYSITDGTTFLKLAVPSAKPDETDPDSSDSSASSSPSTPSTPYIPPVTVPADTASGSTTGAKLEMKASQLPSGVEASDVTFVAKAVEAATAPAQAVSAPAKLAAATLASIPNLPTAKSITVYDLDLLLKSSGEKVDFTGKVTVSIPMPAGYGSYLRVFHVANDGAMTEVPAVISGSNILLTLEHFSHYAVADFASPAGKLPTKLTGGVAVTTAATTAKPSEGGNAGKNPTTGAMLPLLAILGCAGAGAVTIRTRRK